PSHSQFSSFPYTTLFRSQQVRSFVIEVDEFTSIPAALDLFSHRQPVGGAHIDPGIEAIRRGPPLAQETLDCLPVRRPRLAGSSRRRAPLQIEENTLAVFSCFRTKPGRQALIG